MKVGAKLLYENILFRQKRPHRPRPQLFKLFDQKYFFSVNSLVMQRAPFNKNFVEKKFKKKKKKKKPARSLSFFILQKFVKTTHSVP